MKHEATPRGATHTPAMKSHPGGGFHPWFPPRGKNVPPTWMHMCTSVNSVSKNQRPKEIFPCIPSAQESNLHSLGRINISLSMWKETLTIMHLNISWWNFRYLSSCILDVKLQYQILVIDERLTKIQVPTPAAKKLDQRIGRKILNMAVRAHIEGWSGTSAKKDWVGEFFTNDRNWPYEVPPRQLALN